MPSGFKGAPARLYLQKVNTALADAKSVHERVSHSATSIATAESTTTLTAVTYGQNATSRQTAARMVLPQVKNAPPPYEEATAFSGSHKTGVGNSSNIVVSSSEYSTIFSRLNQIDDDMGRSMFKVASDIEELCRGDFVIPQTVQKCNIISGGLKNSLGEYRSLTEDTLVRTRRFVNGIMSIG